jgi:nitrate/nitrite transporter NarK
LFHTDAGTSPSTTTATLRLPNTFGAAGFGDRRFLFLSTLVLRGGIP